MMNQISLSYYLPRLFTCLFVISSTLTNAQRQHINIDEGWKFHLGSATSSTKDFNYGIANLFAKTGSITKTAIDENFDDRSWQVVQLPHDWAVSSDISFSPNKDVLAHGYRNVGGLYPEHSIGWYRKKFEVNPSDSGKRFSLVFDGIYRDSKVWINGIYLGNNFSGYLGQGYDVTDMIHFDSANTVVVRVYATQFEGWFYEGAGINRHVWLDITNELHIDADKYYATTKMLNGNALIGVDIPIVNTGFKNEKFELCTQLRTREGQVAAQINTNPSSIDANDQHILHQTLTIKNPELWDIENPYLYRLVTFILKDGKQIDQTILKYGIRDIKITAENGLFLNGKNIKIKGTNNHQEHAGVGSAIPDALQYYRIQLLKEMGSNAIRTSHAAPAPEFLEACDSLGMLVMDEQRLLNSGLEYTSQLKRLIERDRNHPAIFMWSIGNEENAIQRNSIGKRIAQSLIALQYQLDSSRTSTYAADLPNIYEGVNEVIPVRGFNYRVDAIADYHRDHSDQPIVGTEMGSTVMTRGQYRVDSLKGYLIDQDTIHPWWASTGEHWWKIVAKQPYMMGGFIWTGFDYRGEPTPFEWPNVNSHFGVMDLCGFPKNIYYYYKSWWSDKPVLHIGQHWNWQGKEGQLIDVWVYGNTENVTLYMNDKKVSEKVMPVNGHLEWKIPYQQGILKAVGFRNGKKVEDVIATSLQASHLQMNANTKFLSANGKDIAVVNIVALDEKGRFVADANNELLFSLEGDASILGYGNGDPSDHDRESGASNSGKRKLFNGKAQIILQSGKTEKTNILKIKMGNRWFSTTIPQKSVLSSE